MIFTPTKTPKIIKQLFPNYIWDLHHTGEKKIYLTFDDGPIPEITEFVLKQLKLHQAKATFFCIGDNIKKHPEIFQNIISDNHAIGNHTMNHIKAWKNNTETYIHNVIACEKRISEHIIDNNNLQKLFRPPYGQISLSKLKVLQQMGYKIILWDVLSKDWEQSITEKTCIENVINHTKSGSIIVFHDSNKASKNLITTLPVILNHFSKLGYTFDKI